MLSSGGMYSRKEESGLFVVFTSKSKSRYYGCSRQHATRSGTLHVLQDLATSTYSHRRAQRRSPRTTMSSVERQMRRLTPRVGSMTIPAPSAFPLTPENHDCSIRSHVRTLDRLGRGSRRLTFASLKESRNRVTDESSRKAFPQRPSRLE